MKSQSALEMLIIIGVLMVVFLIVISINTDLSSTLTASQSHTKLRAALDDVAQEAELVYSQGQGAKSRVFISLPGNIKNSSITDFQLSFNVYNSQGGVSTVARSLAFNVTGTLPNSSGNYWVTVESLGGLVNVTS